MTHCFAWTAAIFSTTMAMVLWFRDARRHMNTLKNMLESSRLQLDASRERAVRARGDPEASAIAERSQKIYDQAQKLYNRELRKPWYGLPAFLMGFRPVL